MTPEADRLHRAFVAAYPTYTKERIAANDLPAVDDAVDESAVWFGEHLVALLQLPLADQVRSPLQIVRDALAIPTRALASLGADPVRRDDVEESLLPDDPYSLAPANSRELSDEAWEAHIGWGVAKTEAVAGLVPADAAPEGAPRRARVGLFSTNLMDRTRLESIVEAAGYSLAAYRDLASLRGHLDDSLPICAFVDIEHGASDDAIGELAGAGVRVVAFGPHVDDLGMVRAKALGASDAVARSRFFRDPAQYLPTLA